MYEVIDICISNSDPPNKNVKFENHVHFIMKVYGYSNNLFSGGDGQREVLSYLSQILPNSDDS